MAKVLALASRLAGWLCAVFRPSPRQRELPSDTGTHTSLAVTATDHPLPQWQEVTVASLAEAERVLDALEHEQERELVIRGPAAFVVRWR